MVVLGFSSLLGHIPATAWRAASKAPGPGAEVAGGVAKARMPRETCPAGQRRVAGSGAPGLPRLRVLHGHRARPRQVLPARAQGGTGAGQSLGPAVRTPPSRRPPRWPRSGAGVLSPGGFAGRAASGARGECGKAGPAAVDSLFAYLVYLQRKRSLAVYSTRSGKVQNFGKVGRRLISIIKIR